VSLVTGIIDIGVQDFE